MEMYMSGELGEVCSSLAKDGLIVQLPFHSRTSQFGQLLYADNVMPEDAKEPIRELVMDIKLGTFAKEWLEQILGYPVFNK